MGRHCKHRLDCRGKQSSGHRACHCTALAPPAPAPSAASAMSVPSKAAVRVPCDTNWPRTAGTTPLRPPHTRFHGSRKAKTLTQAQLLPTASSLLLPGPRARSKAVARLPCNATGTAATCRAGRQEQPSAWVPALELARTIIACTGFSRHSITAQLLGRQAERAAWQMQCHEHDATSAGTSRRQHAHIQVPSGGRCSFTHAAHSTGPRTSTDRAGRWRAPHGRRCQCWRRPWPARAPSWCPAPQRSRVGSVTVLKPN